VKDPAHTHWWRVSVTVALEAAERIEETLEALGALAVTRTDAADAPQFDGAVPDRPRWALQTISGLYPPEVDLPALKAHLMAVCRTGAQPVVERVADEDWELSGRAAFAPVRISNHLWVCPPWHGLADEKGLVQVVITPGIAFGTGTHATTQLCLAQLENRILKGRTVLDWGCGSGVLAVAALRLGASAATGVDLDPKALSASRENAALNGVADALSVCKPDEVSNREQYDIVVANILAGTVIDLAPTLDRHLAPDGILILSGLLVAQAARVQASFAQYNLTLSHREEWACLCGARIAR
jgi:ribosomal protein L11 methyltransferase|tara:strand:+ start:9832 stop:10728 length:897 start_codon:yes stop_codon:yes gene_type:complete